MIGVPRISAIASVVVSLCWSHVFAVDCSSVTIKSVGDADEVRQNCRHIAGDVNIGPFSGNDSVLHINLDGVEVIDGTLEEYSFTRPDHGIQPYYSLSSSSLKKADRVVLGNMYSRITNLTLPNLTSVRMLSIGDFGLNLTYLDLTSLDDAYYFAAGSPNIETLRHTSLRNTSILKISPMKIASLDSLTDNQLNLIQASIQGPFPNDKDVAIGFKAAEEVSISGISSITLGGSSTTEMTIGELVFSDGTTDLKRSKQVQTLRVDSLVVGRNVSLTKLEIPFDNLRELWAGQIFGTTLKSIILPPKAVNWTGGFKFSITKAPDLNLTSVYGTDDQGNTIQTWYWPKNVSTINLHDVNVGNGFFDAFVAQRNGSSTSQPAPSLLEYFRVTPSVNSTGFSCAPFIELHKMGRLTRGGKNFFCQNSTSTSTSTSGAIPIQGSIPLRLLGSVLGISIWVLAPSLF